MANMNLGMNPYGGVGSYVNNFQMNPQQLMMQIATIEYELGQAMQQQGMNTFATAAGQGAMGPDQFGPGLFPPGMPMPVPGSSPIGNINPVSQAAGVPPPDQILQQGGVTKGLTDVSGTGDPKWPVGTQQTAGGYFIVPGSASHAGQGAGEAGFTVYKPGTKGADPKSILFENWGDPHVSGPDGKEIFSYSKDSDFRLPDGTILAGTNAPYGTDGATILSKLDIINGDSHTTLTADKNAAGKYIATTSDSGGASWLANRNSSTNWSHDTYNLALDAKGTPSFYDFRNGQDIGLVTGSTYSSGTGYTPKTDANQTNYAVDKAFKPQPGDPAYGNMLYMQMLQVYEDPKYRNNLPQAQVSQLTAQWYQELAATQAGKAGPQPAPGPAPMPGPGPQPMPPPMYPGSQFGGGMNPAMMMYVQQLMAMYQRFMPMGAGGGFPQQWGRGY